MIRISRRRRLIPGPVILAWNAGVALTVPVIGFIFHGTSVTPADFLREFLVAYCYTNCISGVFYFLMPMIMPRLMRWPSRWKWPVVGVLKCLFAAVGTLIGTVILAALGLLTWSEYWVLFRSALMISLSITLTIGTAVSAYHVIRYRFEDATLAMRTRELERERELQAATQARLASLEARVHPHFLFNALNSITSLIQEDPQRAEQLMIRMSALLRFSLDASESGLVPLSLEMKIVEDYLEIERARFGDRLRYRLAVHPSLANIEVPRLSVQTLVENCVKFAVGPQRQGATIEVRSECREGRCWIVVEDDGPGFAAAPLPSGHGLDNLQARLATHFGGLGELTRVTTEGRTRVAISVPAAVAAAGV